MNLINHQITNGQKSFYFFIFFFLKIRSLFYILELQNFDYIFLSILYLYLLFAQKREINYKRKPKESARLIAIALSNMITFNFSKTLVQAPQLGQFR